MSDVTDSNSSSQHRRSRSSAALALLRRKDTKAAGPSEDDTISEDDSLASSTHLTSTTLAPTPSQSSTNMAQPPGGGPSRSHSTRLSIGGSSMTRTPSNQGPPPPSLLKTTSNATDKGNSLEQSIRKFRIVEALRSGDTASLSKAIRETADGAPRASISSATALYSSGGLEDTTILHLAIQCSEFPVVEYVLSEGSGSVDINARDKDGNTALHLAATQGRSNVVRLLLEQKEINDAIPNYGGRLPIDLARNPEIFQQLQLSRSLFAETKIQQVQALVAQNDYTTLEQILEEPRLKTVLDINSTEFTSDPATVQTGGTMLHEAARRKDSKLIQVLLLHGADPFRRDRKGKLPQDVTKDDDTKIMLKRSPAAAVAQRGIQEKAVLGAASQGLATAAPGDPFAGREAREMKGYLKKWTNYRKGYQLRWFVLEDGVLSYYKHQDDSGSACRGAINMRIAKLYMSPDEKTKFEIHGKSSVKYTLKANHEVEAKRWFWALNNSIQWTKDQAKEEDRQRSRNAELLAQAKAEQSHGGTTSDPISESTSVSDPKRTSLSLSRLHSASKSAQKLSGSGSVMTDDEFGDAVTEADVPGNGVAAIPQDDVDDDDEYADGSSDRVAPGTNKDAFNITAQSAKLQLDTMAQVNAALVSESAKNPTMTVADAKTTQALAAHDAAIRSLAGLVGDLMRISKDRDAYWQYRLERETNLRRMWEESMAQVAKEQELLEARVGEAEEKKKHTKRILREMVGSRMAEDGGGGTASARSGSFQEAVDDATGADDAERSLKSSGRRPTILSQVVDISDESENEEEFFDAVDAGEVQVESLLPSQEDDGKQEPDSAVVVSDADLDIRSSFKGYENGVRKRLKIDADNRPKMSLWGILKSMVGKDMTKMTLPVTFNEPTSLLYRTGEDMEYAELLDLAADRTDSIEKMVYVAAFACSIYASTIGRVAKPFNPLLGETFEYARPDKGYRMLIEQVSHHPPIGAAHAQAPKWEYWGESNVISKFYGRSFDFDHIGVWFCKLKSPDGGKEHLFTWKKVHSSVVGIMTGNPVVDNCGPMEIKNHTTGDMCYLDFKPRGWTAASAYQVKGKITDGSGQTRVSLGGRWNSKLYARMTPGYEAKVEDTGGKESEVHRGSFNDPNRAFLIWQSHERPEGIPFNLTPFVLTFNHIDEQLRPWLAPTDSRLRPDQRAMEDAEYDFAATEKNRLEEAQRARRKERQANGDEFEPAWFVRARDETTGEEYWRFTGRYWAQREKAGLGDPHAWDGLERIY